MGISGTTWHTEIVHLSKFAEFSQGINGNIFSIASLLQITTNLRIITCKCIPLKDILYQNWRDCIFQPLRPFFAWIPDNLQSCKSLFDKGCLHRQILWRQSWLGWVCPGMCGKSNGPRTGHRIDPLKYGQITLNHVRHPCDMSGKGNINQDQSYFYC